MSKGRQVSPNGTLPCCQLCHPPTPPSCTHQLVYSGRQALSRCQPFQSLWSRQGAGRVLERRLCLVLLAVLSVAPKQFEITEKDYFCYK